MSTSDNQDHNQVNNEANNDANNQKPTTMSSSGFGSASAPSNNESPMSLDAIVGMVAELFKQVHIYAASDKESKEQVEIVIARVEEGVSSLTDSRDEHSAAPTPVDEDDDEDEDEDAEFKAWKKKVIDDFAPVQADFDTAMASIKRVHSALGPTYAQCKAVNVAYNEARKKYSRCCDKAQELGVGEEGGVYYRSTEAVAEMFDERIAEVESQLDQFEQVGENLAALHVWNPYSFGNDSAAAFEKIIKKQRGFIRQLTKTKQKFLALKDKKCSLEMRLELLGDMGFVVRCEKLSWEILQEAEKRPTCDSIDTDIADQEETSDEEDGTGEEDNAGNEDDAGEGSASSKGAEKGAQEGTADSSAWNGTKKEGKKPVAA